MSRRPVRHPYRHYMGEETLSARLLEWLRTGHPLTVSDLIGLDGDRADRVHVVRSLYQLEGRGLVRRCDPPPDAEHTTGRPPTWWTA